MRFKENSKKHNANVSDVAEREEDGLAMAEDWCGPKEIAGMLGISAAKVKHSIGRLVRQGRLKESAKKHDITDRTEKVCQAVVDGIQVRIVEYLGMKKPDVYYALKKLEKDGRIRCINGYWVAA